MSVGQLGGRTNDDVVVEAGSQGGEVAILLVDIIIYLRTVDSCGWD